MILHITNRCHGGCSHCMQCSTSGGGFMDYGTFSHALSFARYCNVKAICVSGGEPTEHPMFLEYCQRIDRVGIAFSVCSNGMWVDDAEKTEAVKKALSLKCCVGMQVYSHPDFYAVYDRMVSVDWKVIHRKITLETSPIGNMQDLGHAKTCPVAQRYIDANPYYMSCLNGALVGRQSKDLREFVRVFEGNGKVCKPLIAFDGTIHLSESITCPSVGNVNTDTYTTIWSNIHGFSPCFGCSLSKRFLASDDARIEIAKHILGV